MHSNGQEIHAIRIRKEVLKFASSHMTVFPDGSKEALHGHQYVPTVTVQYYAPKNEQKRFKKMLPFGDVKRAMQKICEQWDEKFLLAVKNPYLRIIKSDKTSIEFVLCKKKYLLPIDEVELLPIANITCEDLADLYADRLRKTLPILKNVYSYQVEIEESPGQSASVTRYTAEDKT